MEVIEITHGNRGETEKLHINASKELKEKATEKATKEGRTLTDVVNSLLNEYVRIASEQEQIDELREKVNQHEERLTALENKK